MSKELYNQLSTETRDRLRNAAGVDARSPGHVRLGQLLFKDSDGQPIYFCEIYNVVSLLRGAATGITLEGCVVEAIEAVHRPCPKLVKEAAATPEFTNLELYAIAHWAGNVGSPEVARKAVSIAEARRKQ